MEFGIFNLMGSRSPEKQTAEVFAEVAEQTRLADELGYAIAWFAEHHFSNYCLCASPLMIIAHCASITKKIRLGTAVVVLPLYNPARLAAEIATADALSNGRLMLGVGAGYQPYEFERFGVDIKNNLEMTEEFCDILDRAFSEDFFSYNGKHYQIPKLTSRPGRCGSRCRSMSPAIPRRCSARRPGTATGCCRRAGSAVRRSGRTVPDHQGRLSSRGRTARERAHYRQPLLSHYRQQGGWTALR